MTKLSVNINKIATIRNARGGNTPNVIEAAKAIENFGAEGITVHPRPDERHITRQDAYDLKEIVKTEYNIEGYPNDEFIAMVLEIKPEQVTLVPDAPDAITSNAGWDCINKKEFLAPIIQQFKDAGIRVSIFLDPEVSQVDAALECGADRIELYTEGYAANYPSDREAAIAPYIATAERAIDLGLGINAGHDLSLENLEYFTKEIPAILEVSIGHALISDALYYGLNNVVQMYKAKLA
ncbi:pyridoxine 5'-phosphate synthase [Bacteroidia bacterium]|nr:pyridoxine 5'-phosphate synthase [Bacteroidia bacterium]MDB9881832.1 pyridoxine 5'-phosphate synthase [Bacteroidia bacterium]MDC1395603.1 pyridoxine 5'-phosphate synthase [Bacteroidia bacterium]